MLALLLALALVLREVARVPALPLTLLLTSKPEREGPVSWWVVIGHNLPGEVVRDQTCGIIIS